MRIFCKSKPSLSQRFNGFHRREFTLTNKPVRVILIGPPGGGKGTQAKKIEKDYKLPHISSGDLLRAAVTDKTPVGKKIVKILQEGGFVDDTIMLEIIKKSLLEQHTSWVLDGYPRTEKQAKDFDDLLHTAKQDTTAVLFLDVDNRVIIERVTERLIHPGSGRVYNLSYNPPKKPMIDDLTGEPLIQRDDDKRETVVKRLENYHKQTKPILDFYNSKGLLTVIPSPNSDVGYKNIQKVWDSITNK